MGGRGSSSSKAKNGGGSVNTANSLTTPVDALNLSATQIDNINLRRSDVFRGASQYTRETEKVEQPKLTKTQQTIWQQINYDDNYSAVEKASTKTLQAVLSQANYEYDNAQRKLAKGDYDVNSDYSTNRAGDRVQTGTFTHNYTARQKNARIVNEISSVLEKRGVDVYSLGRDISSTTYTRAMNKTRQKVESFLGKK